MGDNRLQQADSVPLQKPKPNFLLVDVDDICLFLHRRVLELAGFKHSVFTAGNGKKAIDFLEEAADGVHPVPDVILVDLQMPVMDGIGFLKAFRLLERIDKSRVTIVLLSSSICENEKAHALTLGAVKCLSKPFTVQGLSDVISLADERRSLVPVEVPHNKKR